jgi:hypothetical protein
VIEHSQRYVPVPWWWIGFYRTMLIEWAGIFSIHSSLKQSLCYVKTVKYGLTAVVKFFELNR